MRSKRNIKCSILLSTLVIVNLFFINISLAANTAKVNVETVNLREKPDVSSKIYEQLSINDEVEIIEKTGEWYKVKVRNITGYLRQDLLTVKEVVEEQTTNDEENSNIDNKDNENIQNQSEKQEEKEIELGTKKVSEDTRLKIVPVINATDIIEVKKDEEVNVTEIINGWACVETNTTKGWIRIEKLQDEEAKQEAIEEQKEEKAEVKEKVQETETITKFINSTTVNLRDEANTSSQIVKMLSLNTKVEVISEENGWSKVKVDGKEGYISSSLLSDKKQETSRSMETPRETEVQTETKQENVKGTITTQTSTSSGNGSAVVSTAKQYMGSKYVYGGASPSGFDCSGFTSYIYKQYGVNLNRTAAAQYSNGTSVSRGDLQAGDLVMFGKSGIDHVGIYIGGGQMIHAANPSRGVTTDTINSGYYYNNYVGARRVI